MHHPLWDHDISSAPLLIDATIDGRPRKLVAQPTKQSWLYVFDRITGRADLADAGDARCRRPTCRARRRRRRSRFRPSRRRTRGRTSTVDDLIDFTPALRAQALENLKKFRWEPTPFIPAVVPERRVARRDQRRQHRRRHQLAGRVVRSGNGDLLRSGEQLVGDDDESISETVLRHGQSRERRRRTAFRSGKPSRRRTRADAARTAARGLAAAAAAGGRGARLARRRRRPRRARGAHQRRGTSRLRRRRRSAAAG